MSTTTVSRTNIGDPSLNTGWGVIFWDTLEYQQRPDFADRDAGILLVYRDKRDATEDASFRYRAQVVRIVGGAIA